MRGLGTSSLKSARHCKEFGLLQLWVMVHLVTASRRKAPAGGQGLGRVWEHGAMWSVNLSLALSRDVQNASTVDHRTSHSLVKAIMVYLVLISIYWVFLQQENLASS